ncbi:MAG: choice-of-anchor D domain-containing protein [Bacteroidetes bacterium]|nr:choice-of-anchor D domain-containing protein [Bacteroidota bacterium]MCW5896473.1 choice-of-anchor D domain-containing protein [Bacteroidota bacterium]
MRSQFTIIAAGVIAGMVCGGFSPLPAQSLSKMGGQAAGAGVYADAPPAPMTLSNLKVGPLSGTPETMAREFLRSQSQRFNMKSDLSDLTVSLVQESPAGYHVRFNQNYDGIPVYQSDVVVSIDRKNYVEFFASNYKPGISVPTVSAAMSGNAAIQSASTHLGVRGELHGPQTSQLMVKMEKGTAKLAYRIVLPAFEPRGDWEVFVDARSGEVISVTDMTCFHGPSEQGGRNSRVLKVDGSGYVFDPDPLSTAGATYGTGGYVDNNDADSPELNAERKLRTLRDITFSSGLYRLQGPYVTSFDWDPPSTPVVTAAHPDSFRYTRFQDGFEDVMVYFHLDQSQRHIQSLGFTNIQNNSIQADPHGFNGDDNSAYYPSTNRLTFGEGGVDDAEDADVILHEYGHAIHHGTVPGWSGSGQQGALGEGFGDYWAESYSRSLGHWQPANPPYFWVFDWDGHNPFWAGRVLNYALHYPEGLTGTIHTDGQMWSSSLMYIWNEIGREVLDKLVLQSHFYLPSSGVTMTLNAEAVIQADRNLYGGAHLQSIVYWFGLRGFINPANYVPQISHIPLTDTENLNGPYTVTATIVQGSSPLIPSSLKVFWTRTGTFTDSLQMTLTGTPNVYQALIPGNGIQATYRYYVSAKDSSGGAATHPTGAPGSFHSFIAGPDVIPPVITHTPLRDQARLRWPAMVRATVTDNLGVDSVWVDYMRLRGSLSGSFGMIRSTEDNFQAAFPLDTNQVVVGDTIIYKVVARDRSVAGNLATNPPTGFHRFAIISARGVVLVVDDDVTTKEKAISDKGIDERPAAQKGVSSRLIARTLTEVGFVVDTATFAAHDPASYANYDVVVWSAGSKTSGIFGDATKRAALVNRSQAGGKIWVEGGEVGYVFRKSGTTTDADPPFRREVLRDSNWISDVSSANLVLTVPTHPVFTTPHVISSPVPFPTSGIGHRDAMRLQPGDTHARKIAGWSTYAAQGPDTAGIIVYNPLPDPGVGQIVFATFSVGAITDTTVAKKFTENIAEFLMARPGGALISATPSGLDFGAVQLNDSATQFVRVQNLGTGSLSVTNITHANARFSVAPVSFTLGPQDTVRLTVKFKPVVLGTLYDTLRFVSNAASSPAIPLKGHGGVALMVVQPDSFAFTRQPTADTTFQMMKVKNAGTDTLRFTIEESLAGTSPSVLRSMEQQATIELPKGVAPAVNPPATKGGGGPDAFGYRWIDSDEQGGPTYNWTDISTIGTQITGWSPSADDGYVVISLPFAFTFYGNSYSSMKVVTNGWLGFDVASTSAAYLNGGIPATAEPNNALYPWWDDLDLSTSGTVHYHHDAANGRFIVQYTNVPHYGTTEPGLYTFQIILKPSGDVLYQYQDMQQTLTSSTIGIENGDGSIALQVVSSAAYMHNNLAILLTRDAVPWLSTDITQGILAPSDSVNVKVQIHPGVMSQGMYRARLTLAGNISAPVVVPVRLDIVTGVEGGPALPTTFALEQNYPNPFNPSTTIKYALPTEAKVTLKVFNILGQQVEQLVAGVLPAGFHDVRWNSRVATGVYLLRMEATPTNGSPAFIQVRKMLLMK